MTGVRDITQLCFSSNVARIVANKIEQSFYFVYSYSGIESIEHALRGSEHKELLLTPPHHLPPRLALLLKLVEISTLFLLITITITLFPLKPDWQ